MSQVVFVATVAALMMGAYGFGRMAQRVEMEDKIITSAENELFVEVGGRQFILLENRKYITMRTDADAWRARQ